MAALTYNTAGVWGAGVARPLHPGEVDNNFWNLEERMDAAEANPALPLEIDNITVVDGQMIIEMSDHLTTFGPFDLPVPDLIGTGEFQPAHAYKRFNMFTADGVLYLVLQDYTSGAVFAFETNTEGPVLQSMLATPPVPAGGLTGQLLQKASDDDYDTEWVDAEALTEGPGGGGGSLPAGGTTGQVLKKLSGADGDADWATDEIATGGVVGVPAGGATGQVLKKVSAGDGDIAWADDELATGGAVAELPVGGATGQVLKKASAADGDVEWADDELVTGGEATPYDLGFQFGGVPAASEAQYFISVRAWSLPASATLSKAAAVVASTGTAVVDIKKNGSSVGSVTFTTDDVGTFTVASQVDFVAGDVLSLVAPASPDATLADIFITLAGIR